MSALMNRKMNKSHFLAMPFPAQGTISPMLNLCKKIAAEGFTVSFVNVDSIHEQMKQHWVAPAGLDIRLESVPFEWSIPRGIDASCMANLASFFDGLESLGTALGELIERLSTEGSPVLGIISDYFLPFTQAVANRYGIPRIVLWPGCAKWSAIEWYVPELVAGGHILPVKESDVITAGAIDWLPGLTPFRPADVPLYLHLDDKRWKELVLERVPVIKEASWVLVDSFYDLEQETFDVLRKDLGHKVIPVGPLFLLDDSAANVGLRPEAAGSIQWLDSQAEGSVLYISFGSITVLSVQQFEELAQALESSKQPFMLVIRPELVTGGMSEDFYRGFCEQTKDQGFIISWAPQLRVLAHPSVGGFLTHCGWNSMLESMCNGVPMLGWPWGTEQNWNCKHMAEDWKTGARIAKGANGLVEKAEIERAIKLLMYEEEGKKMRKNAGPIKEAGRKAVAEGGLSQKNLLAFLKEIRSLAA